MAVGPVPLTAIPEVRKDTNASLRPSGNGASSDEHGRILGTARPVSMLAAF